MQGRAERPPKRRSPAFTLLEVLLALSLVILLGSLSWPALTGPLASQRLRSAADVVRAEWADARVRAITTGRVYAFRCVLGERRYLVESQASLEDATADASDASAADPSREGVSTSPSERLLPEKVQFASADIPAEDGREAEAAASSVISPMDVAAWSPPVLFFPDGSTSSATLRLEGDGGRSVELTLRGLTGVTSVGPVRIGEEARR